jgi:DNA-binding NarL/FixJ family response regulator
MKVPRTVRSDISRAGAKPRVLVADDQPRVLEMLVDRLDADFEVVADASDGRQALDFAVRFDPDVVVLDVSMPGLDGFQVLRELRGLGSRAKVVLLTLHHTEEFITHAIRSGAAGYVLKTRMPLDLVSAIDHALAGRIFVPNLTPLWIVPGAGHMAQFHANNPVFLDEVSQFIASILRSGELVVAAITERTRIGVAQRLVSRGMDVAALTTAGRYVVMDATESLPQFMRNGRPDADCLADVVTRLDRLRLSYTHGPQSRLTLFGEMAVPLCREGNFEAVVEIERIWTKLTQPLPFLTICSYPIACFLDEPSQRWFTSVCAEHRAISHTLHT